MENVMEQFYNLQKHEREEAILKRLIYCIQCDLDAQMKESFGEKISSEE